MKNIFSIWPINKPQDYRLETVYNYTNNVFTYTGRAQTSSEGKWFGWGGCKVEFTVSGTNKITVLLKWVDNDLSQGTIVYFIDGVWYTQNLENTPYYQRVFITLPDTGSHNVSLIVNSGFLVTNPKTFIAVSVPQPGVISQWAQGAVSLQVIGDSWMNGQDWTQFLDRSHFSLYPVSNGGYTCSDADTKYGYDYTGVLNTTDPSVNGVLISFGVNDYNAAVTVPNFQTTMLSLIDQVRVKQPGVKIFLIRVPNNGASLYGQYGTAMNNIVGLRSDVYYIDTSSLDASMTWADANHISEASRAVFASFVNTYLTTTGGL